MFHVERFDVETIMFHVEHFYKRVGETMESCIFRQDENICIAITPKSCDNCPFYKSSKEYKRIYENKKYVGVVKIESEGANNGGL